VREQRSFLLAILGVVRPTTPESVGSPTSDLFRIRNAIYRSCFRIFTSELLGVVRIRPLVSVAVSGDRYSVSHSDDQAG
jgi:hypothetical protein